MMRAGGMSDGRDIGVVFNLPRRGGPVRVAGVRRRRHAVHAGCRAGRRRCATGTRCSAIRASSAASRWRTAAMPRRPPTASGRRSISRPPQRLPLLFFIEDNGYGISVPSQLQTPGGNIARNLSAFRGLRVLDGDGSDPLAAAELMREAVGGVRAGEGPALLRLTVPRLSGHSGQDTQTYKGSGGDRGRAASAIRGASCAPSSCPRLLPREEWDARGRARARRGGRGARARRAAQRARPARGSALRVHRNRGRRRASSFRRRAVCGRRARARRRLGPRAAPPRRRASTC